MTETDPHVFISYTSADVSWATWVASVLEAAGLAARVQVWDSPPGQNFVEWMQRQLAEARWTVAIYSNAYFESDWCTTEWTAALAKRTLLPVRIEPVQPPETLRTLTWLDLFGLDEARARAQLLRGVGLEVLPRLAFFPGPRTGTPTSVAFPGGTSSDTGESPADRVVEARKLLRKSPTISRLAGVRVLERLIEDAPGDGVILAAVADIVAAHVRTMRSSGSIPEDVERALNLLLRLTGIPRDLTNAQLSGANLAYRNLTAVDLTGVSLRGADLRGALLTSCQLVGSDLRSANLAGAELGDARLDDAILVGAIASDVNLNGAKLNRAVLTDARLERANLKGAELAEADLTGTDNSLADDGSEIALGRSWRDSLPLGHLRGAVLRNVDLTGAVLIMSHVDGADLSQSTLDGARLAGARLVGADLSQARLAGADLTNADLSMANLSSARLRDAELTGANLADAWLEGADLVGARLDGANLTGARLNGARLSELQRRQATGSLRRD